MVMIDGKRQEARGKRLVSLVVRIQTFLSATRDKPASGLVALGL